MPDPLGGHPHSIGGLLTRILGLGQNPNDVGQFGHQDGPLSDLLSDGDADKTFRTLGFHADQRAAHDHGKDGAGQGANGGPDVRDQAGAPALGRDAAAGQGGNPAQGGRGPEGPASSASPANGPLNFGPITSLVFAGALAPFNIVLTFLGQNVAPPSTAPNGDGADYRSAGAERPPTSNGFTPNSASGIGQVVPNVVSTLGNALGNALSTIPASIPLPAASAAAASVAMATGVPVAIASQTLALAANASLPAMTQSPLMTAAANVLTNANPAAFPTSASSTSAVPTSVLVNQGASQSVAAPSLAGLATAPANTASQALASSLPANIGSQTASTVPSNMLQNASTQVTASAMPADRASLQMVMPPATMTNAMASVPAGNVATTVQTAPILGTVPMAPTPLAADPRAAVPLAGGDRAQAMRGESTMVPAGFTGDGVQRRMPRNGGSDSSGSKTQLPTALDPAGNTAARREADAQRQAQRSLERAMEWVFWVLAIVAYGCLIVAIVVFATGSSDMIFDVPEMRGYTTGFALAGLAAGACSWLLARRLTRRR